MKVLQIFLFVLFGFTMYGQVTTSSMSGKVTDDKGEALIGANVLVVHNPTGTQYGTISNENGFYNLVNMRVGGPYSVTISYIGYQNFTIDNIILRLGESTNINAVLAEDGVQLESIEVVGVRSNILNSNRTGAATNVNAQQLNTLPTISRSINDFTRLTPQAQSNSGFGGRDGRYNNIQIDGANFNNNFGLSSNNLPGGDSQPISLDAIEQIQINLAPYDVRQSNFTGAGINAITRSGTNELHGSVYGFYRDNTFNGRNVAKDTLPVGDKTTSQILGARLGGAIIKNKLFFFANFESENNKRPGVAIIPGGDGRTGSNVSRATLEDMKRVSDYVKEKYDYDTGASEGWGSNFETKNYKALARIDYNINDKHRMTFRYNQVVSTNDQLINGTSAPNPRSSSNRVSLNSYAFENANYGFENSVRSLTGELNSKLNDKMSNQFLVTYTRLQDKRTSKSSPFPFIDIKKDNDSYLSLGYELFSWKNDVINNITTFTNNFNYSLGKHNFTIGAAFDYLTFGNSFQRYGTSYYRYSSIDDFLNNETPEAFAVTYSVLPDGSDPYAELDFGLGGLYGQDEFRVNDRLKLTAGLRVDLPFYLNDLQTNPSVNKLSFLEANGVDSLKIDLAQWPTTKPLFSPRIGFNYDVKGDRSFQIRGGTGIFTGRVPFVWFTNLPTNSGMLQNTVDRVGSAVSDLGIKFDADPNAWVSKFPSTPGTTAPGSIAAIDKNFKLPQVWRSNLAFDVLLPAKTIFTFEGLYTKSINDVVQFNANQKAPIGNMNANYGKDQRPFFGSSNADRRVNLSMSEAIVLTNTDQGYTYSLTGQLSKEFSNNFSAMIAYTYTAAKDITGNPGAQAASAWSNNVSVTGQNVLPLANSEFSVPHRVVGAISYKIEYLKSLATSISLFYDGANTGRFSYRYSSDFNGDGINADLIYIPASPNEIAFTDIKNSSTGAVIFTAQEQSDAFFKYVDQDAYLSKNKGSYAERNGALLPWRNRFDLRVLQDIFTNINNKKHTLQLSLDILNVGNLLNSNWGILQYTNYSNGAILKPTVASDGTATFQLNTVSNKFPTTTFSNLLSTATTWGMQVGLRYIF
ncbi:MAG: carboxypeptidase regulatory-like domain-containing protein [Saprospiraceae bacterium]